MQALARHPGAPAIAPAGQRNTVAGACETVLGCAHNQLLEPSMKRPFPVRPAGFAALPAICALAIGLMLATPAPAQLGGIITGDSIDRVAQLAGRYGPAERQYDDPDAPWVRAEMDGVIYSITFLNCDNGRDCSSVQLRAWWDAPNDYSVAAMNRWNRDRRFSKAYLDAGGNPTVEFDINLAGGVTAVNFDDTLQWWQVVLEEFVAEVIDGPRGQ